MSERLFYVMSSRNRTKSGDHGVLAASYADDRLLYSTAASCELVVTIEPNYCVVGDERCLLFSKEMWNAVIRKFKKLFDSLF